MKVLKRIFPCLFAAFFVATYPVYAEYKPAIFKSYSLTQGKSGVTPVFVWISYEGLPLALVTTSTQGAIAGNLQQYINSGYMQEGTESYQALDGALTEAIFHNTLTNINLAELPGLDCRVK